MDVELLLDCQCEIGESLTWSSRDNALYWIDVKAPALHRLSEGQPIRSWKLASDIGAFALLEDATGAVVALRGGLFRLDFETEATELLAPPPFDPASFRFNEGICDARGRFWLGVMYDPISGADVAPRPKNPMRRFTFAEGLVASADASDLHNGFAWSAGGDAFYWSHSHEGRIFRASYDTEIGAFAGREIFVEVGGGERVPDGAAMDAEGCYWCAIHGASLLRRYDSLGRAIAEVELPVSQPTMCAFVGPDLDEMVVTSARDKLSASRLRREPHAGGLFRFNPGVRGVARPCVVR